MKSLETYQITLKNSQIKLEVKSEQSIYGAALETGLQLPFQLSFLEPRVLVVHGPLKLSANLPKRRD